MEPLEVFSFSDRCSLASPYRGPFYKVRFFAKWIILAYIVVIFGISTFVLHEQSLSSALASSLPLLLVLGWLISTRTHYEQGPTPLTISFYADYFTWEYAATPIYGKYDENVFRRQCHRSKYADVTKIQYNKPLHRIEVFSKFETKIYNLHDGVPEAKPCFTKTVNAAVNAHLADYQPFEEGRRVIDALVRYTGQKIQEYGD